MNRTHNIKRTIKVIIDRDACRYQKLRIHNVRCIMSDKFIKISGRLSSERQIWNSPFIAITIEGANREIIDSKVSKTIYSNKHGFFDIKIFTSDIKELCVGTTEEVCAVGIMPLKQHGFNEI